MNIGRISFQGWTFHSEAWVTLNSCPRIRTKVRFHQEGEGYKKLSMFQISTVRHIIRKWKINGTVEVKARSIRPRKISDRMARDLVRNAQKNPHINAKELQKKSSRHRSSCSNMPCMQGGWRIFLSKRCSARKDWEEFQKREFKDS